jgi:hypothetical protein
MVVVSQIANPNLQLFRSCLSDESCSRREWTIQPGLPEIHEQLAHDLTQQGKKEEAIQHYREAVRLVKSGREEFEPVK